MLKLLTWKHSFLSFAVSHYAILRDRSRALHASLALAAIQVHAILHTVIFSCALFTWNHVTLNMKSCLHENHSHENCYYLHNFSISSSLNLVISNYFILKSLRLILSFPFFNFLIFKSFHAHSSHETTWSWNRMNMK